MQLGDSFDRLSDAELANAINAVFLEPTKHYQPRYAVPTEVEDSDVPLITEFDVLYALTNLNPRNIRQLDLTTSVTGFWENMQRSSYSLLHPYWTRALENKGFPPLGSLRMWCLSQSKNPWKMLLSTCVLSPWRPLSLRLRKILWYSDTSVQRCCRLQTRTNTAVFQDPPPCTFWYPWYITAHRSLTPRARLLEWYFSTIVRLSILLITICCPERWKPWTCHGGFAFGCWIFCQRGNNVSSCHQTAGQSGAFSPPGCLREPSLVPGCFY